MKTVQRFTVGLSYFLSATFLGAVGAGCVTAIPPELTNARQEYKRAMMGPAAQVAPADLYKAKMSLDLAEKAFADDPKAQKTIDLAYVADRKAQLAVAIAETQMAIHQGQEANSEYQINEKKLANKTQGKLDETRRDLASSERSRREGVKNLGNERAARMNAESEAADYKQRERDAQDALAKLAAIKEEERGLVITLSGSVLFASNQSTLLPAAQSRLDEVAKALMETGDRNLIVEGHTDSKGSPQAITAAYRRREPMQCVLTLSPAVTRPIEYKRVGWQRSTGR